MAIVLDGRIRFNPGHEVRHLGQEQPRMKALDKVKEVATKGMHQSDRRYPGGDSSKN